MSVAPKYVTRIARLPEVFERLTRHPEGIALETLAAEFDAPVAELREDLLAFYTADLGGEWLLSRPDVLEFIGPDGDTEDPGTAGIVRMVSEGPADLGVEYVDAGELGLVYTAAQALLDIEPDNAELGEAIDVLAETMFGEASGVPDVRAWNRLLPALQKAQRAQKAVRIVYSRAWDHGVTDREIEPYRLVQTRRGWEVDAGPADENGQLRTFLISNIRSVEPLERGFELPEDLTARLDEKRATTTVQMVLPQSARWAADFYAEKVTNVSDDEESVVLDLELLPPLDRRVGMLLLAAGPDAFVMSPRELETAGVVLAEELLFHHSS
ncbi:WYL domain-containing protein [Nocardioides sp. WS12]|uniref:helix-turn-helix transcriptional regulator n=1 Tax=Nocardioides sp. WS12 TaxID=2486272 RepID=UPI0015FBE591|nr:WYL domain-containing protein [Nocardioides sp. WS12]